jgi:hypothetical protein
MGGGQTCVPELQKTKDQMRRSSSELQAMFESQSCVRMRVSSWTDPESGTGREPTSTAWPIAYNRVTGSRLALCGCNTSDRILRHLRHGDYDGILLCDNSSSDITQHADKVYPWEDLSPDEQPQPGSRHIVLPPVGDLMSMQKPVLIISWHI